MVVLVNGLSSAKMLLTAANLGKGSYIKDAHKEGRGLWTPVGRRRGKGPCRHSQASTCFYYSCMFCGSRVVWILTVYQTCESTSFTFRVNKDFLNK